MKVLFVAREYRGRDIGQWKAILGKTYMHYRWCVHINGTNIEFHNDMQHKLRQVYFGQATLVINKRHRPGNICRGFSTSLNWLWSWNTCIGRSFFTLCSHYRAWNAYIALVLHTIGSKCRYCLSALTLAFNELSVDADRGLPLSPSYADVNHFLPMSFGSYTHKCLDVERVHLSLSIAFTLASTYNRCALPASWIACTI